MNYSEIVRSSSFSEKIQTVMSYCLFINSFIKAPKEDNLLLFDELIYSINKYLDFFKDSDISIDFILGNFNYPDLNYSISNLKKSINSKIYNELNDDYKFISKILIDSFTWHPKAFMHLFSEDGLYVLKEKSGKDYINNVVYFQKLFSRLSRISQLHRINMYPFLDLRLLPNNTAKNILLNLVLSQVAFNLEVWDLYNIKQIFSDYMDDIMEFAKHNNDSLDPWVNVAFLSKLMESINDYLRACRKAGIYDGIERINDTLTELKEIKSKKFPNMYSCKLKDTPKNFSTNYFTHIPKANNLYGLGLISKKQLEDAKNKYQIEFDSMRFEILSNSKYFF